jgi:hypothetical protein
MATVRRKWSPLRATGIVAGGAAALLLAGTLPGLAHGYDYEASVNTDKPANHQYAPGDSVEVDFNVTTNDDNGHDWLDNGSGGDWEDGAVFRVSLALPSTSQAFPAFEAFDCYSNSVARRSPLVRSNSEANNADPVDGQVNAAEPATHAGEPVIGGHVLKLSNAQIGTLTSTRHTNDSVEADSNGKFVVDAALPDFEDFPAGYEADEVLLCVESVELYGDQGNVGAGDPVTGDTDTGIGFHCDNDLTNQDDQFCFDEEEEESGASVYFEDGMCFSFCTTYNSTPRIQASTRIQLDPQLTGSLQSGSGG